jgi:hypothetical protein
MVARLFYIRKVNTRRTPMRSLKQFQQEFLKAAEKHNQKRGDVINNIELTRYGVRYEYDCLVACMLHMDVLSPCHELYVDRSYSRTEYGVEDHFRRLREEEDKILNPL